MSINQKSNDYKKSIARFASGSIGISKLSQIIPKTSSSSKNDDKNIINPSFKRNISEIKSSNININQSPRIKQQTLSNFISLRPISKSESLIKSVTQLDATQSKEKKFSPTRRQLKIQTLSNNYVSIDKGIIENSITSPRVYSSTMTILPKISLNSIITDRNNILSASSNEGIKFFNTSDHFTKQTSERMKILQNKIDATESLELEPELYYDERHRILIERLKKEFHQNKIENEANIKSTFQI